jgi:hypothetical protein
MSVEADDTSGEMPIQERIARLIEFKDLLEKGSKQNGEQFRSEINQKTHWVRDQVVETGCYRTFTVSPPPAVGGLVMQNLDGFENLFDAPYRMNFFPPVIDMIDRAIGVLQSSGYQRKRAAPAIATITSDVRRGFIFVAMAIDSSRPELEDRLDTIKTAARNCGMEAERIDEQHSNNPITERILESIRVAEYIIADLSDERPNVFYEAGYALGVGKIPIYVAKADTKLHFDLKDYPIIFFTGTCNLREQVEARLRALAERTSKSE